MINMKLVVTTFAMLAPIPAFAFSDEEICSHAAKTSGFALFSRSQGTLEVDVQAIISATFPAAEYPESSEITQKVIQHIYSLPLSEIKSFEPIDQKTLSIFEAASFQRCMDERS